MDLIGWGPQDIADAASIAQPVVYHGNEAHKERVTCALFVAVPRTPVIVVQPWEIIGVKRILAVTHKRRMES